MKLYLLGSGGWIPKENHTSCFMLESKGELVLLDAGTGVARMSEYLDVIKKYDRISIILSHYHLDHLIGLIYLLPYIADKELRIYGPGKPVYEKTTHEYMKELLQTAFFSRDIDKFSKSVSCIDYAGKDFDIGDLHIGVTAQTHSAPSFRISVDDDLVYATDTIIEKSAWENVTPAKLLLHECWEIKSSEGSKHTSVEKLLGDIPLDRFGKVLLVHQNPEWSEDDKRRIAELIDGTNVSLARDNEIYEL